jgi:cell division inhibitor SulA/protein ImuA
MLSTPARTTAELRARLQQMTPHGRVCPADGSPALRSGHESLDALLPGGGWPLGVLTELLSDQCGIGELELLLPALQTLARSGRCLVWIDSPYVPYAPALVQRGLPLERLLWIRTERPQASLWAAEQALRCPAIGAVLNWSEHIVDRSLRRLQLAAESGHTLGILHRPAAAARQPSPAALRLQLQSFADGLEVQVKKSRGGPAGMRLRVPLHLPSLRVYGHSNALAVHPSAGTAA